jgi:serine/threonine protein kinase
MELRTEMIGKTIAGKYRIQEYLGSGSFGTVFLAEHKMLDEFVRNVAIKISKNVNISQENAQQIFADAICLARALEESKDSEGKRFLVRVYDMGILEEFGRRGYIVMELVSGTTLENHMRSLSKQDVRVGIRYAKQICKGLSVLHSLSPPVIHRDLKPDNILLTHDPEEVRIVDFGLAVRLNGILECRDHIIGVVHYIAPEVLKYGVKGTTPASDVYSVGLILYKMFTNEHPFENIQDPPNISERERLQYHFDVRRELFIEPPSLLNNTLNKQADDLLMRCLEFDACKRYQSASELLSALEDWEKGPAIEEIKRKKDHEKGAKIMEKPGILFRRRKLKQAEEYLLKVVKAQKEDETKFNAMWQLGLNYLNLKEVDKAIKFLEEARKLDETHGFAKRQERAKLYEDLATAHYEKMPTSPLVQHYEKEAQKLEGQ